MSESAVLFAFGTPLYLTEVERDPYGRIKQGLVVNGAWAYKRLGDTAGAFDTMAGKCVHQWNQKADDESEVVVPDGKCGNYNDIIALAYTLLAAAPKGGV